MIIGNLYSETKSYSKRTYRGVSYKGIMKEYYNYLFVLKVNSIQEHYVVAKRVRGELEELEAYCPCYKCTALVINPLKYLWCIHCTRCLKAGPGFADPCYIEKAQYIKEHGPPPQPKYFEMLQRTKTT